MRRTIFNPEAQERKRVKRQLEATRELQDLHSEPSIHDKRVPTAVLYLVR